MNANSRSRLRLFFFRTVLVVAPVVAIGLLLEIALRAKDLWVVASFQIDSPPIEERAMVPSRHEGLRVEFNPGYSSGDFSVNEFGMADDAVALERTPGVTRIAVFGDSISGNFRLEPRASSFPTRLEVDLNRLAVEHGSPQRFEVLNFGVNSYSIRESFRMAELRVPRFDPDIVIVQLCWNDSKPTGTRGERATAIFGLRAIDWVLRHINPERFWAYANVDAHFDAQGWADWSRVFTDFAALSSQRPVFAVLF
ncbi:MAG: SGNH/GDSL hydrolase family protein, partial [Myxococcota bacterium]|nr:SGNH/GDSL hydrolase family protein [Myxococcota bacterium]